jgi:hypothetical protein
MGGLGTDHTILDAAPHGIQRGEGQLTPVSIPENRGGTGREWRSACHQAWPDGVRVPLPPAGRGAHAPAGGSARPRRDAPLYRQPLAMHHGAVRLEDISVTSAPIQWTPGPPLG